MEEQLIYWKEMKDYIYTRKRNKYAPSINILNDILTTGFTMLLNQVFIHPSYEVILERALDNLMQ
jgi:hypothetical protein